MKNKIIKTIFILLIVVVCVITYVCKLSKNYRNHSCFFDLDSFTKIEESEDTTDVNCLDGIPFPESKDDQSTISNNEAGQKSNEGDKEPDISSNSVEYNKDKESEDSSFADKSGTNKEENAPIKETESDDKDEGIVLPDDEW